MTSMVSLANIRSSSHFSIEVFFVVCAVELDDFIIYFGY